MMVFPEMTVLSRDGHRFTTKLGIVFAFATVTLFAGGQPPEWAYGTQAADGAAKAAAAVGKDQASSATTADAPQHLKGSDLAFTRAQIGDRFGPADWFPNDHPKMPAVVAHGRKPEVWACSLCHYPNGKGRPENAGISGLPVSYFIHEMQDFKKDLRRSADPRKKNTSIMVAIAKAMTDDEIEGAADYFGSIKWTPWIRVLETDTVKKTRISVGMFLPLEGDATEPLGKRIIEMPAQADATEVLRDPRSGFIAYAPIGSLKKGRELVVNGSGKTIPCAICHGADLNGLGPVPGIAGRSPSYLTRQMYDLQLGTRKGEWTELMKSVVSKLSEEDMLNIAAYAASLTP